MKLLKRLKIWACRALMVAAGFLGGALLGWLSGNGEHEKTEEVAGDSEIEARMEEEARLEEEKAKESVLALDDDDFDRKYPAPRRSARQGGDRFVDRTREYFLKRRGGGDRSGSDGDRPGGD